MRRRNAWRLVGAAVLGVVWAAAPAAADIFLYRDADGRIHFSNAPAEPTFQRYRSGFEFSRRRAATPPDRHRAFDRIIRSAARRHGVEAALVKAVIRAESDFVPWARSPKGAMGLMQLMPATARAYDVWEVYEPSQNVEGGVRHLRHLLDRYAGDVRIALAAYNAGGQAVGRYGGIPPYPETQSYVRRVLRFREQYLRE